MQRKIIPGIVSEQNIVMLPKSATVHDAVQAMSTHKVSALAVANSDGELIGIVSERDMTHRVLACGLSPQSTYLMDVMTENPETLRPDDNALDAIELMLGRNFRHLPVVTDEGKVIAMVSIRDLLNAALIELDIAIEDERTDAFAPSDA